MLNIQPPATADQRSGGSRTGGGNGGGGGGPKRFGTVNDFRLATFRISDQTYNCASVIFMLICLGKKVVQTCLLVVADEAVNW